MTKGEKAAVQRLLRAGRGLLEKGLPREAADAFGRVLFKDPRRDEARRGLARARRLVAEEARIQEASVAEPRSEPSGRAPFFSRGRLKPGVPATDALARRRVAARGSPLSPSDVFVVSRRAVKASSRRTLVTFCAVFYTALIGIVAFQWERFVETLVRTPSPVGIESGLMMSSGRTRGEFAVTEALRLAEGGDSTTARSLLETIPQADPAYPFSRHLQRRLMVQRVDP
ncbi:MAG: hypothetical protein JXO72_09375 [Vicinamibacteria bacterium]|nr:hypothetical protein [Vicinamibacteria bacterium]